MKSAAAKGLRVQVRESSHCGRPAIRRLLLQSCSGGYFVRRTTMGHLLREPEPSCCHSGCAVATGGGAAAAAALLRLSLPTARPGVQKELGLKQIFVQIEECYDQGADRLLRWEPVSGQYALGVAQRSALAHLSASDCTHKQK